MFMSCLYHSTMTTESFTLDELKSVLDDTLAPLRAEVRELKGNLESIEKFLDFANAKYEEVLNTLSKNEEMQRNIIAENKVLKSTVRTLEDRINHMQSELNDREQYSRRECVEIHGVPLPEGGETENTNEIVSKIGELMRLDIEPEDISVSHRLPASKNYKGKRPEPVIIAKFVRRDVKETFYRARKKLRDLTTKFVRRDVKETFYRARKKLRDLTTKDLGYKVSKNIYINESLTESNKALFKECVKVKKDLEFTYIWTSNGKIFLRKDKESPVVFIKTKDDIAKKLLSR